MGRSGPLPLERPDSEQGIVPSGAVFTRDPLKRLEGDGAGGSPGRVIALSSVSG